MDGDTAAVGASGKLVAGKEAGAVFVFVRAGGAWTLQSVLLPPAPVEDELWFGTSVALSKDTLVVGTYGNYPTPGKAYVYVRTGSTWSRQATLTALDPGFAPYFGVEVAVSGDTALVSAPHDSDRGYWAGAAYVFVRTGSTWSQQQKLAPQDLAAGDAFGASVAVEGNTALVGASGCDTGPAVDSGCAYVFTRSSGTWSEAQKLRMAAASGDEYFGATVALSGDQALVGAPYCRGSVPDPGCAVAFSRVGSAWTETATLVPPSPAAGARYGSSLSLSGSVAVLGGLGYPSPAPVHVFRVSAGTATYEAALSSPAERTDFGWSLAVSGTTLLVGAPALDNVGAAFVFTPVSGAWTEEARLDDRAGTSHGDRFGAAVAVAGDTLAVGSPSDDTVSARGSGSVTIFKRVNGVWILAQKIVPEPDSTRSFGRSLALEGTLLVVGAGGAQSLEGSVYIFRDAGRFTLEKKLAPADQSGFGAAVATGGGVVLVGEPGAPADLASGSGAVSVFSQSTGGWALDQRLRPPATAGGASGFGASVALTSDVLVVGAPGASRAFAFRRLGGAWTPSQEISGTAPLEDFGASIAVQGVDLAVGSPGRRSGAPGAVYLFRDEAGVYAEGERLVCPAAYSQCGSFVALSGDTLLAGDSAALFSRTGGVWDLRQELKPRVGSGSFAAGAIAGTQLLVGHPQAWGPVNHKGAVLVFGPALYDLTLAMAVDPGVVSQGDLVRVSLALGNGSAETAAGLGVAVAFEPGLVFHSASIGDCAAAPWGARCAFGAVDALGSGALEFRAAGAAAGTFVCHATVAGGPSAEATVTILAASADVAVAALSPPPATRGGAVEYLLTVRNDGPAAASDLRLTLSTPAGLVLRRVAESCVVLPCLFPQMPAGGSALVRASYDVPEDYSGASTIVAVATVRAANADPDPGNNVATVSTRVLPDRDLRFHTVAPCRLFDTRERGIGGPDALGAGPTTFTVTEACGVPSTARALAGNVTVTRASFPGHLRLYPAGHRAPGASFLNYGSESTRSNNGVIGLDGSSRFVVEVDQEWGSVHVIIDVVGYFE
jgi:hypothetical protein